MGTLGEHYITPNDCVMMPYCGKCGAECETVFKRLTTFCPLCGQGCWVGPFTSLEGSPGPIILPLASPARFSSPLRVPDVVAAILPTPTLGTLSKQPPATGCATASANPASPTLGRVDQELASIPKGGVIATLPAKKSTATHGKGCGRVPSTIFPVKAPSQISGAVASASCSSEEGSLDSIKKVSTSPLQLSHLGILPPTPSFLVSPGRADPKKQCTISRIQRIINIKVYFYQWGYFMPYAPKWVFDEMEKHLDKWIYELIRKENIGGGGLLHSDATKRECDLRPHSCGKFHEEKHFSLSEPIPNGGRFNKSHPNYYLSYEDTKSNSCLGKEIHPAS
ncbi:hypothetical protein XELAEV_18021481mg [Xenopus laevis]|uniref:Uncharacterized protein n=1 Tax=Xenopus laevis TaxID=8355 RepID=A0A974HRW0_XENLA|nr:hypothetical protein XELAEV_18021481mg [Xenopus laevis]